MKTVIFTFDGAPEERVQNVSKLKEQLNAEVFTGGKDTIKNLADLCKACEDDLLIFEDDVELCENFSELSQAVIQKYPETVINFHFNTFPKGKLKDILTVGEKPKKDLKIYEVSGSSYIWNQCFYVPNMARKLIIEKEKDFRTFYPYFIRTKQQDVYVAYCIRDLGFLAVYPSLVNHLDLSSTIRDAKSRKTIFPMD